jgi:nucleoside-diphosphate-sugar epimerase
LVADRADETALRAALGAREFDTVIDQVCATPAHAAVARRVFADRTARYVMTSTIEVYDPATAEQLRSLAPLGQRQRPVREERVDPTAWPVDHALPWDDADRLAALLDPATRYAEGKRQAEAVFAAQSEQSEQSDSPPQPPFAFASVRSTHVLGGGPLDFTGRLAHYTERIAAGRPIEIHPDPLPTSFIHHREIAEFLAWAAAADFTGPVNACSHGELDVIELSELIADQLGAPAPRFAHGTGAAASPFSFDRYYAMDNTRATELGFTFAKTRDWLPEAIAEAHAASADA